MLSKLFAFASLYRELGPRWLAFRLAYAFRLRTGLLRVQMPMAGWEDLKYLVSTNSAGRVERAFFPPVSRPGKIPEDIPWDKQKAIEEADRILKGELKYFAHEFVETGFPPDWHTDYFTRLLPRTARDGGLHPQEHWSQITEGSAADIKLLWEPNRFFFVYTLVRAYAVTRDEKYAEAFWQAVGSWAEANPPNTGPNWMDGQEISLRLMAWTFGYQAFLGAPSTTPERKDNFLIYIAAQAERIYQNRSFAIFTRGNHAIAEAFGLWMVGLLFPELKNAEKYLSFGKMSLEHEARAQLFPDGTYSMYSLNYHRFVLQIYLYALQLAKLNNISFSDDLQKLVTASLETLSQFIEPRSGQMPIYGSNDGALVLPLNNCDFTDHRPLLQLGWHITKGERLFVAGPWDEDVFWLCGDSAGRVTKRIETSKAKEHSFPLGGIYLLRNTDSYTLIRCTDFTARPSHADQLHVDLWMHGHNIAVDAGTYLYSGEGIWRNGLAHTSVHNTVTVDGRDQMTMLSRFTWTNWSKGKVLRHDKNLWQGEHDSYQPVSHKRTVMASEGDRWLVIDRLTANESQQYAIQWLLCDGEYEIQRFSSGHGLLLQPSGSKFPDSKFLIQMGLTGGNGNFSLVRAHPHSTRGWRSRYYGHKEPAISVMLETHQPQVTFWTFFGVEGDRVELTGDTLQVNGADISLLAAYGYRLRPII